MLPRNIRIGDRAEGSHPDMPPLLTWEMDYYIVCYVAVYESLKCRYRTTVERLNLMLLLSSV